MQDRDLPRPGASVQTEGERQITPVTFRELGMQIYKERVAHPEKPLDYLFFFAGTKVLMDGPEIPMIGFYCDPAWGDRIKTRISLLGVDSLSYARIPERSLKGGRAEDVYQFQVYDFDVAQIADPAVVDDLRPVEAQDVAVAANEDDAKAIGGWVADPRMRDRIIGWFKVHFNVDGENPGEFGRKKDEILNYAMLRQVPFNTENSPRLGKYTYEGMLEEVAIRRDRGFTPQHVEWLKVFMTNKGLEIPQS